MRRIALEIVIAVLVLVASDKQLYSPPRTISMRLSKQALWAYKQWALGYAFGNVAVQGDWIGLKKLDQAGKLSFREIPGGHMHFSLDWCAPTSNFGAGE